MGDLESRPPEGVRVHPHDSPALHAELLNALNSAPRATVQDMLVLCERFGEAAKVFQNTPTHESFRPVLDRAVEVRNAAAVLLKK